MNTKSILIALLSATAVSALGTARVLNNCNFPVTVWAVGRATSPPTTLGPVVGTYEYLATDPISGGRTIKITREPNGIYTGKPELSFAYTLSGDKVWYDLNQIRGEPFAHHRLRVSTSDKTCPVIEWSFGHHPGGGLGSQVKQCGSNNDVVLELCAK